ncbi:FitA-like ribbon-helix-helix domain-containing protein [Thiorhodovibrio frisius]|uniref:Arc-like DNA binding domain protein n=1 Tax=Thiorhodovibrio frisius TaxID=631362 RepID=H8Z2R5_9GAMM|nr:Arc family DNA-binding protein [Thiorhodovibrio frisius]EIC21651.1 Arc-like DNA binding domain protein [Thiorhodovibrio frisius]WPL21619.1 Arc-like DNA binding domain protein [Thiorhodovibrio frisius]
MSSLTLKNLPDQLLEQLRVRARAQRRSLNSEAMLLLEQAMSNDSCASPAQAGAAEQEAQLAAWARLSGRWPGGDAALTAMAAEVEASRTLGREFDL